MTQTELVRLGRRDPNRKPNIVSDKTLKKIAEAHRRLCGNWCWRKPKEKP